MESILVIEDNDALRQVLAQVLTAQGYGVTTTSSAEAGLDSLRSESYSLVLSDLKLPGISGIDFIKEARKSNTRCPIVVMTAYGSIEIAVEAMKLGATEFITKPFNPDKLLKLLDQVIAKQKLLGANFVSARGKDRTLVTDSSKMELVLTQCRKVAALSSNVMILGESGTGKELLARFIHDQSPRSESAFLAVNCGSMPDELLESEFFGHEIGSFTGATEKRKGLFEMASGGTLLLDEIGNMPPQLQVKLLRTLQESEVKPIGATKSIKIDTRIISATNAKIEDAIERRLFREDLYYRLGVVIIEIPPLRERKEDIPLLANYFLKRFATEAQIDPPTLSNSALAKMLEYSWPGNVRELENVIERGVVFCNRDTLSADDIELSCQQAQPDQGEALALSKSLLEIGQDAADEAEREAILSVLQQVGGNRSKAARLLKVSYKTLLNKMKQLSIVTT